MQQLRSSEKCEAALLHSIIESLFKRTKESSRKTQFTRKFLLDGGDKGVYKHPIHYVARNTCPFTKGKCGGAPTVGLRNLRVGSAHVRLGIDDGCQVLLS